MVNSRNKGSAFERDIAKELARLTGFTFKRNLEQVRAVDNCDLLCSDPDWPFSLELKRYAKGCDPLTAWIEQAKSAAAKNGKFPCVVYKFDMKPIKCHVQLSAIGAALGQSWPNDEWATITLEGLAYIAREIMATRSHLGLQGDSRDDKVAEHDAVTSSATPLTETKPVWEAHMTAKADFYSISAPAHNPLTGE